MVKVTQRDDGLVEFDLRFFHEVVSCSVCYCTENGIWKPAALYKSIDSSYMLDESDWTEWNNAILSGLVNYDAEDTEYKIFWNKYINIGSYTGTIHLKFAVLTANGITKVDQDVNLAPDSTVYIGSWSEYTGSKNVACSDSGRQNWVVSKDENGMEYISAGKANALKAIEICPCIEGLYEVFICLKNSTAAFYIGTDNLRPRTIVMTGGNINNLYKFNFKDKAYKEFGLGEIPFKKNTKITISQLQMDRKAMEFGNVSYLKLVPVKRSEDKYSKEKSLKKGPILYFEPYSYAAILNMLKPDDVQEVLESFLAYAPSEITCQVCRIGSKTLHYSNLIEKFDIPAVCDDKQVHDGAARLVRNMDVLEYATDYCRKRGILITANIGVNSPYLWLKEISESFSQKNHDKIKNGFFDYTCPEVMNYAVHIIDEVISNYDVDGLCLDFMRRKDNQTKETLIEFIRKVRSILTNKKEKVKRPMRLTVRIPYRMVEYYEAAEVWVREGLVDVIVPSNTAEMVPLPRIDHYINLCKNSSTKVFGCIDGWKNTAVIGLECGNGLFVPSPEEVRSYVKEYKDSGAEGVFVYQADNYVFSPFIEKDMFSLNL